MSSASLNTSAVAGVDSVGLEWGRPLLLLAAAIVAVRWYRLGRPTDRTLGTLTVLLGFGFDACDWLFGYKDKIRSAIQTGIAGALDSSTAKAAAGTALRGVLDDYGVGYVQSVSTSTSAITVRW